MDWIGIVVIFSCCSFFIIVASLPFFFRDKNKQTTFVYCPGCKRDLVSGQNSIVTDEDFVRYYCGECFTASTWDFDCPVPILVWTRSFELRVIKPPA